MVKDSKRCTETQGWCYFNYGHHAVPYEPVAQIAPKEACAFCHIASADKDQHFSKFYPLLQK